MIIHRIPFFKTVKNKIISPHESQFIDVFSEWKKYMPDNIQDIRSKLPKNENKEWSRRELSQIKGLCIHQIAGHDNPYNTAAYHVKHFPAKTPGAPGLCYTFHTNRKGVISLCNNIEDVTWSQGYAGRPGSENVDFLAIVCGGDFSAPGHVGVNEPTLEQMLSLLQLVRWLCFHLGLDYSDVYGHYNFGKRECPGTVLETIIGALNKDSLLLSWSIMTWQKNLSKLGYDLGNFGSNGDGCDGVWGEASKKALRDFQKDSGIAMTGFRDRLTQKSIEDALSKKSS